MLIVNSKDEAWKLVNKLIDWDYRYDNVASKNAGYSIYYSTKEGHNAWINDLNERLEINYEDGTHQNIWIDDKKDAFTVTFIYDNVAITLTNVIEIEERNGKLYVIGTSGEGKIYPLDKVKNLKVSI